MINAGWYKTLSSISGFEGVDLLREVGNADRFVFIEKWSSIETHKNAALLLPNDALAPLMATLAGRPEACYLDYLPTT